MKLAARDYSRDASWKDVSVSSFNPYQPPAQRKRQNSTAAVVTALRRGWTASFRTFVVLSFIVFGTSIFYNCLFDTWLDWRASAAGLCAVSLLICPATFLATYFESQSEQFLPDEERFSL
ncbi:MAG: hypothetical protein R3C19_26475 [Planctomycetaceae bacterium]